MVPGFLARLKSELSDLLADENRYGKKIVTQSLKFFKSPAKENYTAWLGGVFFILRNVFERIKIVFLKQVFLGA